MADRTRSGRRFAGLASIRARLTAAACLVVAGALLVGAVGHPDRPAPHARREPRRRGGAAGRGRGRAGRGAARSRPPSRSTATRTRTSRSATASGRAVARTLQPDAGQARRHLPPRGRRPGDPHPEDPRARGGGRLPDRGAQRPGADVRRGHDLRRRQPRPRQGDRDGRTSPPALGGAAAGGARRGDRLVRRRPRPAARRGDAGRGRGDHGARTWAGGCRCPGRATRSGAWPPR